MALVGTRHNARLERFLQSVDLELRLWQDVTAHRWGATLGGEVFGFGEFVLHAGLELWEKSPSI